MAKKAGLSRRYVYQALAGGCSLSSRVRTLLQGAVSAAGWRYALGKSDLLPTGHAEPARAA